MDNIYALGCTTAPIDSKGTAMYFAILMSSSYCGQSGTRRINYKKAKKLFDFICSNVDLPEVKPDPMAHAEALFKSAIDSISAHKKEVNSE